MSSAHRREKFMRLIVRIIAADNSFSMTEFSFFHILTGQLGVTPARTPSAGNLDFESVRDELGLLLNALARAGGDDSNAPLAFDGAWEMLKLSPVAMADEGTCTVQRLGSALARVNELQPLLKQHVIAACASCVIHDGRVTVEEAELLQAIALLLDCPMPPVLEGG